MAMREYLYEMNRETLYRYAGTRNYGIAESRWSKAYELMMNRGIGDKTDWTKAEIAELFKEVTA